jgi:hypothetical protein
MTTTAPPAVAGGNVLGQRPRPRPLPTPELRDNSRERLSLQEWALARQYLPYGFWDLEAGRLVVFNHRYHPVFQVELDGSVKPLPYSWVTGAGEPAFFHDDSTSPHRYKPKIADRIRIFEIWQVLSNAALATAQGEPLNPNLSEWLRSRTVP